MASDSETAEVPSTEGDNEKKKLDLTVKVDDRAEDQEPTGFLNTTDSQFTFAANDVAFEISPSPGRDFYDIFFRGNRIRKEGVDSVALPNVAESYWIYFTPAGVLTKQASPSVEQTDDIMRNNIPVTYIITEEEFF